MMVDKQALERTGRLALEQAVDELIAASRPSRLNASNRVVPERLVRRLLDVRTGQRLAATIR